MFAWLRRFILVQTHPLPLYPFAAVLKFTASLTPFKSIVRVQPPDSAFRLGTEVAARAV